MRHLETVEVELAPDGEALAAELTTRLEASGDGPVRIVDPTIARDVSVSGSLWPPTREHDAIVWSPDLDGTGVRELSGTYPRDELPLAVAITYHLDGDPVAADELTGASGTVRVGVRVVNTTAMTTDLAYPTVNGRNVEEAEVAAPLLTDVRFDLDPSWRFVTSEDVRVSAGTDGGTAAHWTGAMFAPFGSTTTELTLEGRIERGRPPTITIEATPVHTSELDLLERAGEVLESNAAGTAVAAVFGETLADAAAEAAEGAGQLGEGIAQLQRGIEQATAELPDLDPDELTDRTTDALTDDLDPDAILDDLFDPEQLLDDVAAQLAAADLAAALGPLLAELDVSDLAPDLDLADLAPDLAPDLANDLLDDLVPDPAELLPDPDELADELTIDDEALTDLVRRAAAELDPAADLTDLLAELDLTALLDELDPDTAIDELLGDATLGDLLGEVALDELVATLLGTVDLELELSLLLAGLLERNDLDLPTVGSRELDEVVTGLTAAMHHADELADGAAAMAAAIEDLRDLDPSALPTGPAAETARAVAATLRATADELEQGELPGLPELGDAVAAATVELDGLDVALDEARDELGDAADTLAPVVAAVADLRDAVGDVDAAAAEAQARIAELLATTAPTLVSTAAALDGLADELEDPQLLADAVDEAAIAPLAALVDDVRTGTQRAAQDLGELAAITDELADLAEHAGGELDLGELLASALDDGTVDLAPMIAVVEQRLVEVGDELGLADLPLTELVDAAGVEPADLVEHLDLEGLADALGGLGVDLDDLVAALDLDLAAVLADADIADDLLAELAPDLDQLDLDALDLDALDLDALDLDGPELDAIAGELDDVLADVDPIELLQAAGVDPAALFDGLALPDLDEVLGDLGAGLGGLLDELGLGQLDELADAVDGFGAALEELDAGAGELSTGVSQLADDGLGGLVDTLDDDNRAAQRDLALLDAASARIDDAHPTAPPDGAETGARYVLTATPASPPWWPVWLAGGVAALAGAAFLRHQPWRRFTGGGQVPSAGG